MSIFDLGKNDVSDDMQAFKDRLSSKDAQIAAQQGQLMRKSAELDEIKQSLNEALEKLNIETSRVLRLENSLNKATSDLTSTGLSAQNTSTALTSTEEKLRVKALEAKELEEHLHSLSRTSDERQAQIGRIEKEKKMLEMRVKELEASSRVVALPPAITPRTPARGRSSSMSDVRITTLEKDLSELRAVLASRDSELQTTKTKLDTIQRDAIRTNNEQMASEARFKKQVKELEEMVEERDEELQFLKEQGGGGSLEREEELLKRIDEDDARIEALEHLIEDARDMPKFKERLRKAEESLKVVSAKLSETEGRNIELVLEKEEALDELEDARGRIAHSTTETQALKAQSQATSEPNEETVASIERLLGAVNRIRGERDDLRRDMEFLDMESKFTITALEAKVAALSFTPAPPSYSAASDVPMSCDVSADQITPSGESVKRQDGTDVVDHQQEARKELQRLRTLSLVCGIVIGHLEVNRTRLAKQFSQVSSASEEAASALSSTETHIHELEGRLATTLQILEETTSQRNDATSQLSTLDVEWRTKLDDVNTEHQETRNTMGHLNVQLDEMSKALEAATTERNSLHVQVANLNTDIAAAQKDLAAAESRYTTLQFHQLSDMPSTQATKALRSQIEELEARVLRRTEQVGIQQHDIRRMETNLKLQEERLVEMTGEMETVLAEKNAMVEDCADARERRDEALATVERLEEEVERLENLVEERERAQEAILEVMFTNSARTRERIGVEAGQIEEMKARMQSLLVERDGTLQDVRVLNDALQDATQRLQTSEEDMKQVAVSLAVSQTELNRSLMSTRDLAQVKTDLSGRVQELEDELQSRVAEATALASQLDALQGESSSSLVQRASEIAELQSHLEDMRSTLSTKQEEHRAAVEVLQRQLAEKDRLLASNDLEGELVQLKMKHIEEVGQLQSRLVETSTALDEIKARYDSAELDHKETLDESAQSKAETERQLRDTTQELTRLKETHAALELASERYTEEVQQLQERVDASNSELDLARHSKTEVAAQLQRTAEELEKTRDEFEDLLSEAQRNLAEARKQLDEERAETSRSRDATSALRLQLDEEVEGRDRERSSYKRKSETDGEHLKRAELRVEELTQQVDALESQLREAGDELQALQEDRNVAQRDMTALEANVQRSLSMHRHLESQIRESEHTISNLRSDLAHVNNNLAKVEKACNSAEVNLSLQTAQHQREVSQLQRELDHLKSRPDLEQVVSELEERNNEMEELLRKRCEEIEENDDVKLGLMKENKSLKNKVESLTRKVTNLQTKLAAAKATLSSSAQPEQRIPSTSSKASLVSPPPSVSPPNAAAPSTSRPRSTTLVGTTTAPFGSSRVSPPAVPERLTRVVSGPSSLPRPKTPERRTVLTPVFKAMSPKKEKAEPSPSVASGQSKKRRAPDDFEGYQVPPQVFTAESLPGDSESEPQHTTPKVRRVLSSIQSGFTPVRYQSQRPTVPLPSPKRSTPVFMKSPAGISDTTGNVFSSGPLAAPIDRKKSSWLGKIRGASSATPRELP